MTYSFVYWFTRLDALNEMCLITTLILGIVLSVGGIIGTIEEGFDNIKKYLIAPGCILFLALAGVLFIPTQKEAAAIYLIPKLVNNEQITGLATGSLDVLEALMKEYLADVVKPDDK